jgi:CubicO group peptidase (beta-lactamase class C family)
MCYRKKFTKAMFRELIPHVFLEIKPFATIRAWPKFAALLLVFAFCANPLFLQEPDSLLYDRAIEAFEKFVAEQMAFDQTPGISVGFIKDDFIWTRGFGYADLENRVPAKPESSYRMASITKTFTAFAVLLLVQEGKMDLDAEIQTYVPYFPRKKWPVTIRQLLGHLGGISHYEDRDKELHIKNRLTTREAIAIFQDFALLSEPGTEYLYSSYGYNLLGAAIEGASGQSYGEFIKKHIFDLLGMSDSCMDDWSAIIPNRVRGYRLLNGRIIPSEYVDMSSRFASGGTRSTVIDLLKYARGIIQGKLLEPPFWRLMLAPMATRDGLLTGRGMSWNVRPLRGHFQINHGGSQAETKTYLLIFPLTRFAVAIASNLESFDREYYAYKLAELVLEEDLDTPVYLADESAEPLYAACDQVFSYGLSQYGWHARHLAEDEKDLEEAFAFFDRNCDPAAMRRDTRAAKNNLSLGIQPASGQAFTKVGSFMAAELEKTYGRDRLLSYHKSGPVFFFKDYLALAQTSSSLKNSFRFSNRFRQMFSRWEKDWTILRSGETGLIQIGLDIDFDALSHALHDAYSRLSLYPDHHEDLIRVAQYHLKSNRIQSAFSFLDLAYELYPNRTAPMTALASLHLWTGSFQEARRLFLQARAKDPSHPGVSLDQFQGLARDLIGAKKIAELKALAGIIAELYPGASGIFKGLGDMFLNLGQNDSALLYYKKALKLDRKLKDVREKIKILENARKK